MQVLITGATGFLGQHCVHAFTEAGHSVRAMYRDETRYANTGWQDHEAVTGVRAEMRDEASLSQAVEGVDAVVHLAATLTGDWETMRATTVEGTQRLLSAMDRAGVKNLVLISSMAVYDYQALQPNSVVNEDSPIETNTRERDAYCAVKLEQESIVRSEADRSGCKLTILRPGAIYGPGRAWTSRLGSALPMGMGVMIGGRARMPMTYVSNVADAVVRAATGQHEGGHAFNIVDDETPTQSAYLKALRQAGGNTPKMLVIPLGVWSCLAGMAGLAQKVFAGKLPLPQLLRPRSLAARVKPLQYTNQSAKSVLGWSPRVGLEDGIRAALAKGNTQS